MEEGLLHPWLAAHLDRPYAVDFRRQGVNRPADLDAATLATLRAIYFGLVAEVDHHIGRVLEALVRRDLLDRTLVVVTSDHGEMLGDHWMLGKSAFFPQAFHVPLMIRAPSGPRGRVVEAFTEHVDLYAHPAGGLGPSGSAPVDGHSLGPYLKGEEPSIWRGAVHYEHDFRDVVGSATRRRWASAATSARSRPSSTAATSTSTSPPCRRCSSISPAILSASRTSPANQVPRARCWPRRRRCSPGGCWRMSAA